MKKVETVWEERVAKERPPARSQPKYSWQVPPSTTQQETTNDQADLSDLTGDLQDQLSQNIAEANLPTDTEKVPVTSTKKESVTSAKKVPVIKIDTSTKKVTDTEKVPVATFRIPHQELDYLFKELDSGEFKLYLRLYRLSHGWGQESCKVGDNNLMETLNMSKNAVRAAKQGLTSKNLIQVLQIVNLGPKGYTEYRVLRVGDYQGKEKTNWYQKGTSTKKVTDTEKAPNKDDDHDDLNKDHHQSNHEKEVMMIYQKLTNNYWSTTDSINYQKIKNIPLEAIEMAIKLATQRAANRPNSLAYFVKEIINTANPPKQNRSLRKKIMEKIVDRVRNSFVGSSYTMSDFTHKVKDLCFKEDINFDNDIFDELVAKKK